MDSIKVEVVYLKINMTFYEELIGVLGNVMIKPNYA